MGAPPRGDNSYDDHCCRRPVSAAHGDGKPGSPAVPLVMIYFYTVHFDDYSDNVFIAAKKFIPLDFPRSMRYS